METPNGCGVKGSCRIVKTKRDSKKILVKCHAAQPLPFAEAKQNKDAVPGGTQTWKDIIKWKTEMCSAEAE